ncbi:MAG: flagellar hook-length control protein FliK [Magnetococcales bacterium]|nr:flagellar hook-length control protein FliK [Magnetococcales bacterium]
MINNPVSPLSPSYPVLSVTPAAASSVSDLVQQLKLSVGDLLVGRVLTIDSVSGQGSLRLTDGTAITFTGGNNLAAGSLAVGEMVQLEVSRTAPQITLRLAGSESALATQLAESTQQTVARAPEVLARLVTLLQTQQGGGLPAALRAQIGRILQQNLPTVPVEALWQGEITSVSQLLTHGQLLTESGDAIQQLRLAMAQLQADQEQQSAAASSGGRSGAGAALTTVQTTLSQLSDLLTLQTLLPSLSLTDQDGSVLAGYRLFLLDEGGWGEAIWRYGGQSGSRGQGSQGGNRDTITVMLSLAMTQLGRVQARLSASNGQLWINLAAEQEQGLSALRQQVGELRDRLLAAGLPLQSLDLQRLTGAALESERRRMLGLLEEGFVTRG